MEQHSKREALQIQRAESRRHKQFQQVQVLARNFKSKAEVKEMTDLSLGENNHVLAE